MRKLSQILGSNVHAFGKQGFTLIELIVVITVIVILSSIGMVAFVSYAHTQALDQATNDLLNSLNTAKALSLSQLKTLSKNGQSHACLSSENLVGYGISINTSNNTYSLYMTCSSSGDFNTDAWKTTLVNNITFNSSSTNISSVFFPVLTGGIVTKGSGNADTIVLTSYSMTKTISITNGYMKVMQ
jgi:prepilin-type N-terminal cleavage/methylation domain-containing protein